MWVIMIIADGLVLNRHRALNSHHFEPIVTDVILEISDCRSHFIKVVGGYAMQVCPISSQFNSRSVNKATQQITCNEISPTVV